MNRYDFIRWPAPPGNRLQTALSRMLGCLLLISLVWQGAGGRAETPEPAYPRVKTAGAASRWTQTLTGFTPVSGWLGNRLLSRALSRALGGPVHARLRAYSGTDLWHRRAKSLRLAGNNLRLAGSLPLTRLSIESDDASGIFISRGTHPVLLNPVIFHVRATLSEADLNRWLSSPAMQTRLSRVQLNLPPFGAQTLSVQNPRVTLLSEHLAASAVLNTPGAPPENALPLTLSARLQPEKSRLQLSDLALEIEGVSDTRDIAQFIEHYFSEVVDFNRLKVARHKLRVTVEQATQTDRGLSLQATVQLAPKAEALRKAGF